MKRLFTCIALVAMSIGAWANTLVVGNSQFKYSDSECTLGSTTGANDAPLSHHVDFVLKKTNGNFSSGSGNLKLADNSNCEFRIANLDNGYTIAVNSVSVTASHDITIGKRYFQLGDQKSETGGTSTGDNTLTVNNPTVSTVAGWLSLSNNNVTYWVKNITIVYTMTPAAPSRNGENISIKTNDSEGTNSVDLSAIFVSSCALDADVALAYEVRDASDNLLSASDYISGTTFSTAYPGSYKVKAYVPAKADCHEASAKSEEYLIQVEKKSQTLSWDVTGAVTLFDDENLEETATATSSLDVTYSSNNTNVIKYENGAWVVVAAGTATIYADQAGNDTYEAAAQISKTITVLSRRYSKESGELAWENLTEDNTKSMFKSNGNLITTTAFGKHGTICLPYNATVEGAVIYSENPSRVAEGLEFAEQAEQSIVAGHAYIYFATANQQTWYVDETSGPKDVDTDHLMEGNYADITLANGEYFFYTADEYFHPAGSNVLLPAFRACIPEMPNAGAPVRLILPKAGVATGVENAADYKAVKALVNGKLVIVRGAKAFNVAGQAL